MLHMRTVNCEEENVGGKEMKPGPKRKFSDSTRKRNKREANAKLNRNRIYMATNMTIGQN